MTGLLAAFALPALLLAALGIYGVVAYLVTQRSHEFGIRMALGAQRHAVLRMVLGEGMRLAAVGVILGALGAAATTRWLRAQLYEVARPIPLRLQWLPSCSSSSLHSQPSSPPGGQPRVDPIRRTGRLGCERDPPRPRPSAPCGCTGARPPC